MFRTKIRQLIPTFRKILFNIYVIGINTLRIWKRSDVFQIIFKKFILKNLNLKKSRNIVINFLYQTKVFFHNTR
jgi:hypothetical protein